MIEMEIDDVNSDFHIQIVRESCVPLHSFSSGVYAFYCIY